MVVCSAILLESEAADRVATATGDCLPDDRDGRWLPLAVKLYPCLANMLISVLLLNVEREDVEAMERMPPPGITALLIAVFHSIEFMFIVVAAKLIGAKICEEMCDFPVL